MSVYAKFPGCSLGIGDGRSENSPSTTQNSLAKFCSFPERALLFHNNSPATLLCPPATTILNENPEFHNHYFQTIILIF